MLLLVVGSDVSIMEGLGTYGRPLYQRATRETVLDPFTPWELAKMLNLGPVDAFDAYLVLGGFPLIAQAWRACGFWAFLGQQLSDPTSPLIVTGERILQAEFPTEVQAKTVLRAIGTGERTFTGIQQRAGGIQPGSLTRALATLTETKGVVESLVPHVPGRSNATRYVVGDAYLRFWLRFIGPNLTAIERGRGTSSSTA